MSSDDVAIRVSEVSKHYLMFEKPEDRLKQMIVPRLSRLIGRPPRQYFRDFTAVSNVSFDVKRGETVGIIGRNGSGKSTMLQMVVGTLTPSSGTIAVHGRIAALLELGAGFNPEFTGRENVYLNAAILGLTRAETEQRFDAIAAFADIGIFIDQPVKTYSSGMYVRLAFAVAINVDPDILVVDEALSVGDEAFQRKCFARIEDIRDKGATILFVSHGAQTIVQLCDRAMLFDRGEMILAGRPKTAVAQYQRLANAAPGSMEEVRRSIISYAGGQTLPTSAQVTAEQSTPPRSPDAAPPEAKRSAETEDSFDAGLVSVSRIEVEPRGARISHTELRNLRGELVNALRLGRRYAFSYTVDFEASAAKVGFGMLISDSTGLGLVGAQTLSSRLYATRDVMPGSTFQISFEFTCNLLPRTYFISAGVQAIQDGDTFSMHRIGDALAFRVAPEDDLFYVGRFSADLIPTISRSESLSGLDTDQADREVGDL